MKVYPNIVMRSIFTIFLSVIFGGLLLTAVEAADPWVGNKLGIGDDVPSPWTPVEVSEDRVRCWGRETYFAGRALPAQITTQSTPLFIEPMTIQVALAEDSDLHKAGAGTGKVTECRRDRVVWEGALSAGGIPVETRVEMEFDGFTWLTLKIKPNPEIKVKRLAIDIPIQESAARHYKKAFDGYSPVLLMDMWGRVDKSRQLKMQDFTLANEELGISFFSEGRRGWWLQRKARQLEWIKKDDRVIVRLNLIDLFVPQAIEKERVISFGWNALPVKPMLKDGRRYFFFSIGQSAQSYQRWFETGMSMVGVRLTGYRPEARRKQETESDPEGFALSYIPIDIPRPYNVEGFKKYIADFHKAGAKVTVYTVGNMHNVLDDVFFRNFPKWSAGSPDMTEDTLSQLREMSGQMPHSRNVCGWSSFTDYKVWFMTKWFKELGLDGYYYDNQVFVSCENPKHTDHLYVDEDDKPLKVAPLLCYRDTYKRIYREIKKTNPDSIIVGHDSNAAYPFIDLAIGGEALRRLAGETAFYTEFFTPEECKGPYLRGQQIGIPFLWLPEYSGKFQYSQYPESVKATRAMLSLIWLTDSCYWVAYSNLNVLHADLKVRGKFKIWEAEWLPFWSQEALVADQKGVYITAYKRSNSVLLVVSNPGKGSRKDLTVSADIGKLFKGIDQFAVSVTDAETEKSLDAQRFVAEEKVFLDFKLSIPNQDYRLIRLDAQKAGK